MKKIIPNTGISLLEKVAYKFLKRPLEVIYLKKFFKNTSYPKPFKGKVLIYAALSSVYNRHKEVLIYHLLKKAGYEVDYFVCQGELPACEILTKGVVETTGKENFCKKCSGIGLNTLKGANVDYKVIKKPFDFSFTESISKMTLDELLDFKHENIDFGNIARGVLYRYFKSLNFGEGAKDVAAKYLEAALINYSVVKEQHLKNNYDYFFFSHGIYSTWQPVVEYCEKNKINYVCYDRAKKMGSANFNLNFPSPVWDFSSAWERYSNKELKPEELKKVDNYLKERELQKDDVYAYNYSEKTKDLKDLKEQLNIKEGSKVITFFTNLIWDAANVSRDIAFKSPLESIQKTIEYYKENEAVHILIRSHPAEKIIGTGERYGTLVKNMFTKLPSNVSIIEPEMAINSFTILEISDIGIVHTSTVGLEMAIENKPVILISETHYRGKGFTYDAQSENDFFDMLNKLVKEPSHLPNQITLAKKYFYIMMFEYQKQMPFKFRKGLFNGYNTKSFKILSENTNEEIVKIINSLDSEALKDFVFWN